MIIEFVGVPCSGKSRISHDLSEFIKGNNMRVCEKQYEMSHGANRIRRSTLKLLIALKECICHPCSSVRALSEIEDKVVWVNFLYVVGITKKNDFCILEQGLGQCVSSLYNGRNGEFNLIFNKINNLFPEKLDRTYVFIDVLPETIIKRMNMRSSGDDPFYCEHSNQEDFIESAIATVMKIKRVIKEKYGEDSVISIDNNEENSVQSIVGDLYHMLGVK